MNTNENEYHFKNKKYYIMDLSAFEQPIISKEDTSPFTINFINQKDHAMKPINIDESYEEESSFITDEKNLLYNLNIGNIIDNNLFLLSNTSGKNISINVNVNKNIYKI